MRFFKRTFKWLKSSRKHKLLSLALKIKWTIKFLTLDTTSFFIAKILNIRFFRHSLFLSFPKNNYMVANTENSLKIILNSSDLVIGKHTFIDKKAYDSHFVDLAFRVLKKSNINLIYDIGANIGTIGIYAVHQGLAKECLAFEPEPNNFKLLRANVLINSLEEKIKCFNYALSDRADETLDFELDTINHGEHRVRKNWSEGKYNELSREVIKVSTKTLNNYFDKKKSINSLIFMDTQGFEGYVLSGASLFIDNSILIISEFWPYGLKRSGCFEKFLLSLDNAKYESIIDLENRDRVYPFNKQTIIDIANKLGEDSMTNLLII